MNVVDAALVEADGVTTPKNTVTALVVLATEVRRLRAGVEAVRALPRLHPAWDYDKGVHVEVARDGWLLDRTDVLAALEVSDGA